MIIDRMPKRCKSCRHRYLDRIIDEYLCEETVSGEPFSIDVKCSRYEEEEKTIKLGALMA